MMENSKVMITGIITETDFNSNIIDIIRPVARVCVYDKQNKEWIDNIYLIFPDNTNARKFRGLHIGDVILLTGELCYYSGTGYSIYVIDYTILESNIQNAPLDIQKTLFFNKIGSQNYIFIKGTMLYYNKNDGIITIAHTIEHNIRGDLEKKSIEPVRLEKQIKNASKNIVFLGHFTKGMISGEAYETI